MSCDEIREKLSLYLEEELPDTEREALDRHLAACAACAETLSLLREVSTGLRRMEEAEPPPRLARKIQEAIADNARRQRARPAWWRSWAPALAAAAVVLLTIGTVTYLDKARIQEEPIIPRLERPAEAPAPTAPSSQIRVEPQTERPAAPPPQPAKAKADTLKAEKKVLREAPVPPAEKPAAPALGDLRKDEAPAAPSPSIAAKGRMLEPRMERDKISEVRSQAPAPAVTAGLKAARPPDAVPAAVIIMSDPTLVERAKAAILALGGKVRQDPRRAPELRALAKEYRLEGQEAPVLEYSILRARYPDLIQRLRELDPKMSAPSLEVDTRDAGRETLTFRLEVRKAPNP
ncbi:MAG: zf-HC2 domain-containing protein [Nitrospirae bacterium]|nr:zf-HC2 domain-containing protein [Nitrospirota bacterium]